MGIYYEVEDKGAKRRFHILNVLCNKKSQNVYNYL